MDTSEQGNHEIAKQSAEAYIAERRAWLADAVEVVAGDRNADLTQIFEAPMQDPQEARAAQKPLELTLDQETRLREIAGRFGIGAEADVLSTADYQIMEGGKPWKVESEAAVATNAKTLIFAGSPFRKIGADELDYMEHKHNTPAEGPSEYDMVRQVAQRQVGFQPLEQDEVLPFGYEIDAEHSFVAQPTGQLVKIGTIGEKPVLLLKVQGEAYQDEQGKNKERYRPDSAALMEFTAQVLSASGDETSSVGLNSSTTYAARSIDTMRAGLRVDRVFQVGMYGRQTVADIKGEPAASPSAIQNIGGELRIAHDKLTRFEQELGQSS